MNGVLRIFWLPALALSMLDSVSAADQPKVNFDPIYLEQKTSSKDWLTSQTEVVDQKKQLRYFKRLANLRGNDTPVGNPKALSPLQAKRIFGCKLSASKARSLSADKVKEKERGLSFKNVLYRSSSFVSLDLFEFTPGDFANKLKDKIGSGEFSDQIDCKILKKLAKLNDIGEAASWFYGLMIANTVGAATGDVSVKITDTIPPVDEQLRYIRGTEEPLGSGAFIIPLEKHDEYVSLFKKLSFYDQHLKISKNTRGGSIVTLDLQKTTPALFADTLKNILCVLQNDVDMEDFQEDISTLEKLPKTFRRKNTPAAIINQFYGVIMANTAAICETND